MCGTNIDEIEAARREKRRLQQKLYRQANMETLRSKYRISQKAYRIANREVISAKDSVRHKLYREANLEYVRARECERKRILRETQTPEEQHAAKLSVKNPEAYEIHKENMRNKYNYKRTVKAMCNICID
jgi:hypothetical protein